MSAGPPTCKQLAKDIAKNTRAIAALTKRVDALTPPTFTWSVPAERDPNEQYLTVGEAYGANEGERVVKPRRKGKR